MGSLVRTPPRRPHLARQARMTNNDADAENSNIEAGLLAPVVGPPLSQFGMVVWGQPRRLQPSPSD